MLQLRGKRALLTGAASEAGAAVSELFLALGAEVVAADRHRTALDGLRASLGQHARLDTAEWDPSDPAATERLLAAWARAGEPHVVVCLQPTDADATRRVLDAALETMRGRAGGSVVVLTGGDEGAETAIVERVRDVALRGGPVRVNVVSARGTDAAVARASAWLAADDSAPITGARVELGVAQHTGSR